MYLFIKLLYIFKYKKKVRFFNIFFITVILFFYLIFNFKLIFYNKYKNITTKKRKNEKN